MAPGGLDEAECATSVLYAIPLQMAEGEGFEPPRALAAPAVFQVPSRP